MNRCLRAEQQELLAGLGPGHARGGHTLTGCQVIQVWRCTPHYPGQCSGAEPSWQPRLPPPTLSSPLHRGRGRARVTSLGLCLSHTKPLVCPSVHWITALKSCAWEVSPSFKSEHMWRFSPAFCHRSTLSWPTLASCATDRELGPVFSAFRGLETRRLRPETPWGDLNILKRE